MKTALLIGFIGLLVAVAAAAPAKRNKCKDVIQKLIKRPPRYTRILLSKSRSKSRMYGRVKYECVKGAKLDGKAERRCSNGRLLGKEPVCRLISCGIPKPVAHANCTGAVYTVGSVLKYTCESGYRLKGRNPRKCRRNGKWTKKPQCELITCSVSRKLRLKNGNISTTDPQYRNGSSLLFECKAGHDLIGSDTITCSESGWSSYRLPYCKRIACPNPGRPTNGQRRGRDFGIGATVSFSCQSGLTLRGSRTRTCQSNQMWSGSVAVCDDGNSDCPNPGTPLSGWKSGNRYSFGSLVRFACRNGYVLIGSRVRKCQLDGTWNGTEAKCMADFEYMVKDVNKTAYNLKRNLDSMLEYTCSGMNSTCNMTEQDMRARAIELDEVGGLDVVFVFDASSSIKKDDFQLGLNFAVELVKQLGASWKPGGTHIAAITYGTEVHLEFNLGDAKALTARDVMKSIKKIKRGGGGTASRLALDEVIKRVVPFTREGSQKVLFFITDGHSNIGGKPGRAARRLRDEEDFQIFAIGVGKNVLRRELMEIASEPEDEYVISVRKYKELLDAVKKAVHIEIDYTPCGESQTNHRARIVGGNRAGPGTWPWQVGIYRVDKTGNLALLCGGALVSKTWVLTAAHCFYHRNSILEKVKLDILFPEIYTVKVGDHHMQVQEPTQQELSAEQIVLHPNYKHSPLYFNDIALVKLEKEVKLGASVRTVCLPKKGEKLLTPKKHGIVAGWGARQILRLGQSPSKQKATSKILRHSAFTIQPDDVCSKTKFHFNSTLSFCAGDGKGGNDTCKGDSGGSFVREVLRDGKYRWVSAGLVSWGEGCGLKDKYGYYTRVERYIDWIKQTAV